MPTPEELARHQIDAMLTASGWVIQDRRQFNLGAGRGIAVREFPVEGGEADYLLFVDRQAVGVVESKPEGVTLSGVAEQSGGYLTALPPNIPHVALPLPFAYESTGVETFFRSLQDPACGTGGFLLAAHDYIAREYGTLTREQWDHLRHQALHGWEIVDNTARLCVMNLYLHGIGANGGSNSSSVPPRGGGAGGRSPIHVDDALAADPGERFAMILTNPPFGKKSSVTYVTERGELKRASTLVVRDEFWTSTANKQLNFIQHVKTLLQIHGRAAVVVPDNVLFEGGAGEVVRRKLLHECDVHTLLRLPTGIFYAQGVKANVIFFDRKPASETPWTKTLWIYDLRTNKNFTLKTNPLQRAALDEFVACYHAENRHQRTPAWSEENPEGRWRAFAYEALLARDKVSLDIFWLRDESLEDSANLPDPDVLAAEIVEDLEAALAQFKSILADLGGEE